MSLIPQQYNERQVMLTLAYIAYTGFYSIGLDKIYAPQARMPLLLRLAWKQIKQAIGSRDYAHVRANQKPLQGQVHVELGSFYLTQAIYQHVSRTPCCSA